nr:BON domain-containing protein [Pseudomonas sp.]
MQDDSQRRDDGRNQQSDSGGNQARPDEQIRGDVYEALSLRGIDVADVSVQVRDGRVTLDGSVSDVHMKQRIEDIASTCAGIQRIDNNLGIARAAGGGRDTAGKRDVGTGITGELGKGASSSNASASGSGEGLGSGPAGSAGSDRNT